MDPKTSQNKSNVGIFVDFNLSNFSGPVREDVVFTKSARRLHGITSFEDLTSQKQCFKMQFPASILVMFWNLEMKQNWEPTCIPQIKNNALYKFENLPFGAHGTNKGVQKMNPQQI